MLFFLILLSISSQAQQQGDDYCGTFTEDNLKLDPQPRPIIPHEILIEHSEFIVHCSDLDYDYGYSVYLAASYSYDYYFNVNNWQRPPSDNGRGGDNRYDIYIYPPQDNARGQTFPDGEGDIRPSFIEIKPNINDNPSVTVAHEIFHSIQFGYAFTKLKPWFGECTATWMGVQVFPGTGEEMRFYFNPSFNQETPLSNPEYPMDHPGFYYEYANFIFAKFLVEWQNSPLIIKEIFERLANISTSNISEAIDLTLQEFYNSNFSEALLKFSEWKYFTGQNNDNLHFENADLFPAPTTDNTLDNFYIYSFGGCRFIVKATWQDLLVSFAAANNFTTWGALVIEDGVPDSSRSVRIILNSSGQGQTFARAIENNKVILIPVGIDLVYHESPRQQHGSFSTPNLPSRSPQFKNEYNPGETSINLGGQLFVNDPAYPDPFNSGTRISLPINSTKNIKTLNERFQNPTLKKHNNWNELNSDYLLETLHTIFPSTAYLYAKFLELHPAEIQILLEDQEISGLGLGAFTDPWYYKLNEPQGGTINFNGSYEPTGGENVVGKGVFLNQDYNISGNPFYSVQTSSPQNINVNGQNRNFHFLNWTGENVNYQNATSLTTGVVFQETNAKAQALFKGNLVSNHQSALNTSQRKLYRLSTGEYFTVYESMNRIWFTYAESFDGEWYPEVDLLTQMTGLASGQAANPSIDVLNDIIHLSFEYRENESSPTKIYYAALNYDGSIINNSLNLVDSSLPSSMLGKAKPVIAYFEPHNPPLQGDESITVYYRNNLNEGFYVKTYSYIAGHWVWENGILANTSSACSNICIAPVHSSANQVIHQCWQNSNVIYYNYTVAGNRNGTNMYSNISSGSTFEKNVNPSVSLTGGNNTVVVSWLGYNGAELPKEDGSNNDHKMVTRVNQGIAWGAFFTAGDNVGTVSNNSVESSNAYTVIAWSENDGANAKWIKRVNTTYCNLGPLTFAGKSPQVSNATGLDNIEVMVLNTSSLPYTIERCTNNFNLACDGGGGGGGMGKITAQDILTYGRTGIVVKNSVEFVFNIGDVIVGDSIIQFIYSPDTIKYLSAEEMSSAVRTETFHLSPSSDFLFSNFYYVLFRERADTALTDSDRVTFRAELVNSSTGEISGVFDEITYDKNQLEKYDNTSYQVNCSGITEGDYYLRIITLDNGESTYNLANAQNYGLSLRKHSYTKICYDGSSFPTAYELSQNYPNPFNPLTTINYQIPKDGMVSIRLYDILGKEVSTLVDGYKTAGKYSIQYNGEKLSSGVYIYTIKTNDFVQSKKMSLIK